MMLLNDLPALPLRVASPCVELLVLGDDEVVVLARANACNIVIPLHHRGKALKQQGSCTVIQLPVIESKLAILIRPNGKEVAVLC